MAAAQAAATCRDTSCFEEAFRSCEPATAFTTDEAMGARVTYEIVGTTGDRCRVSMVYFDNPNPDWIDKPVRLTLDPQQSFMAEIAAGLTQCMAGTPERFACEGPLLDELRP